MQIPSSKLPSVLLLAPGITVPLAWELIQIGCGLAENPLPAFCAPLAEELIRVLLWYVCMLEICLLLGNLPTDVVKGINAPTGHV